MDHQSVISRFPDFSCAKILVAGDVMLDRYWSGATHRISPEAPVPVVRVQHDEVRAGGAANVALNIASLGARAVVLGVTGNDLESEKLAALLSLQKVQSHFVDSSAPTITKLRVMSRHQQLLRLDFEEHLVGTFDPEQFLQAFLTQLIAANAVILSDYGKGTLGEAARLIAAAKAASKPVLIDPKGRDWRPYTGATLITPNVAELEAVVGPCSDEFQLVAKGQQLRTDLGLTALLVTRSEQGMTLLSNGPPLHLPALAREVFDVTGAGDTVIATFASALAAGAGLNDAAHLANVAAGIVVGKLGTATVSTGELHAMLHADAQAPAGVLDEPALIAALAHAKARGQKLVMTNGCFDVLHVGHLRYLQAARELGDVLIVAVNTDGSVQQLKGPTRPLNALADRMALLAGLRCVDFVVGFSEATPARLIAAVLPDVLVKGGDYRPEQIAGADAVWANGGSVQVLDFHAGYSTSRIIEKARQ